MIYPVHRDGIRWIVTIPYVERHIAKDAGFRWDPEKRHWYTTREDIAQLLWPRAASARWQRTQTAVAGGSILQRPCAICSSLCSRECAALDMIVRFSGRLSNLSPLMWWTCSVSRSSLPMTCAITCLCSFMFLPPRGLVMRYGVTRFGLSLRAEHRFEQYLALSKLDPVNPVPNSAPHALHVLVLARGFVICKRRHSFEQNLGGRALGCLIAGPPQRRHVKYVLFSGCAIFRMKRFRYVLT